MRSARSLVFGIVGAALAEFAAPSALVIAIALSLALAPTARAGTDVAGAAAAPDSASKSSAGLSLGSKAPDFSLSNLDGSTTTLAKLLPHGPVLLDFWALWCKPCLQSLPGTDALRAKYADRGLTVLAIDTDSPRSIAKVKAYVKSNGFKFDVLLDPNGTMQRLYRFYRIPQTFVVAADGSIAFSQLGYTPGSEERVEQAIEKVLAPAPAPKGE